MEYAHASVLLRETIDGLKIQPDGVYLDGTLGGGGHTRHILDHLGSGGRVVGIDQDEEALKAAGDRLADCGEQIILVHDNFSHCRQILRDLHIDRINGAVLDLGVSSYQLDNPDRGFSYRYDAPLDMRMDRSNPVTAADIVNTYSEQELARVIRAYGEEKFARTIAMNIAKEREKAPVETTFRLVDIIQRSIPAKYKKNGHPAKRTFQAIRIELNKELAILEQSIDDLIDVLAPSGRLCVITFHSLEDRIVKECFRRNMDPCTCPPDFPVCVCGKRSKGTVITKKPVVPSEEELAENPRASSAKLRIFERGED